MQWSIEARILFAMCTLMIHQSMSFVLLSSVPSSPLKSLVEKVSLPSSYTPSGKPSATCAPLTTFLDYLQQSLLSTDLSDESNFIEAGRDIMAVTRFQSIQGCDNVDQLALTCWTEIEKMQEDGKTDTGCLIILPDLDIPSFDLSDFVSSRIVQPLSALDLTSSWSIKHYSSAVSSSDSTSTSASSSPPPFPAIRLLHKVTPSPSPVSNPNMTDEEMDRKVDAMYERAERQVREKKEIERRKKERKEKKKSTFKDRPGGAGFGMK
mmetsp:Transcript_22290/g.46327  ORF Transcript_22290/g.46327 Transcript_22290/m.46327 type:complete len:265 (+) Transcript_22290:147-941(+)